MNSYFFNRLSASRALTLVKFFGLTCDFIYAIEVFYGTFSIKNRVCNTYSFLQGPSNNSVTLESTGNNRSLCIDTKIDTLF